MNLIGITGLKTSGKDTTYEAIRTLTGGQAVRRAFADNLKRIGALALGLEFDQMERFKEIGQLDIGGLPPQWPAGSTVSGRQYLQNLGVGAREVFGLNFWVDQVLPIDKARRELIWRDPKTNELPKWAVVTDVRFPNEAHRVLDLGGEVWEVVRPGLESDGHASEIPLPRYLVTRTLNNNSTIHDLTLEVEHALRNYTGGGS